MTESDNVTDNLVFAVNSLITLYQIRHFYLGRGFIGYPKGRKRDIKLVN